MAGTIEQWRAMRLLRGVSDELMPVLVEQSHRQVLAEGDLLLSPEQPNRFIYFVVSGQLCVRLNSPEESPVAAIVPGQCSGEVSILDEQPPSAWVSASQPTELLVLNRDQLWALVEQSHALSRNLLYVMSRRIRSYRQLVTQQTNAANTDSLTELHNRRWLDRQLPRLMSEGQRDSEPLALLMIDVDHFKQFNDRYGHAAGDKALEQLAAMLRKAVRGDDEVIRYGGEEFTVLLPHSDESRARAIAERVRQGVEVTALDIEGVPAGLTLTVSVGAAVVNPGKPMARSALLRQADHALYAAKGAGRNRVMLFSETD